MRTFANPSINLKMPLITGFFVRALLPRILSIPIVIYLYAIDRYFIKRMGRLD